MDEGGSTGVSEAENTARADGNYVCATKELTESLALVCYVSSPYRRAS